MTCARCPLQLDPPWSPGGVDQQVLQEIPAAQQQVGQGRSGDPGFGDPVAAAVGQGGTDLPELPADVAAITAVLSRRGGLVGSMGAFCKAASVWSWRASPDL